MQHLFEFIAEKKLTIEEIAHNANPINIKDQIQPIKIQRYYSTESNRKAKVSENIYKELAKKPFEVKQKDLENFYLRQLR